MPLETAATARYARVAALNPGQGSLMKDGWTVQEISHEIPLTGSGRAVVKEAQRIAGLAGAVRVEPDHLLLAVLGLKAGLAVRALPALGMRALGFWHMIYQLAGALRIPISLVTSRRAQLIP